MSGGCSRSNIAWAFIDGQKWNIMAWLESSALHIARTLPSKAVLMSDMKDLELVLWPSMHIYAQRNVTVRIERWHWIFFFF